jgi:hypothetical protein
MKTTLIQEMGLDYYTYVDTDGIVKTLDFDACYDSEGGSVESFDVVETKEVAWPWLHDYSKWTFQHNYHRNPDSIDWNDLPF